MRVEVFRGSVTLEFLFEAKEKRTEKTFVLLVESHFNILYVCQPGYSLWAFVLSRELLYRALAKMFLLLGV
jgi:hypothetical protein